MKLEWFLATMTKEKDAPSAMEMSSIENEGSEMSRSESVFQSSSSSQVGRTTASPGYRPGPLSSKKRKEDDGSKKEVPVTVNYGSPMSATSSKSGTKACPKSKRPRLSTESKVDDRGDNALIDFLHNSPSHKSTASDGLTTAKLNKPGPRSKKFVVDDTSKSGQVNDHDNRSIVSRTSTVSIKSGTSGAPSKSSKEVSPQIKAEENLKIKPGPRSKMETKTEIKGISKNDDETLSNSSKKAQRNTSPDSDYESKSYTSSASAKSKTEREKGSRRKSASSVASPPTARMPEVDMKSEVDTSTKPPPALSIEELRQRCWEKIRASKLPIKDTKEKARKEEKSVASQTPTQNLSFYQSPEQRMMMEKWSNAILKLKEEIGVPENVDDVLKQLLNSRQLTRLQESFEENKPLYLFEAVLPHISKDLRFRDLLNCRLVCSRWTRSVDDLLENHPHRQGLSGNDSDDESNYDLSSNRPQNPFNRRPFKDRHDKQRSYFHLFNLDKVQSLLTATHNHPRNPFVTRAVLIRSSLILSETELSEFWESVLRLLKAHGKNVWHLQLEIQGYQTKDDIYPLICRVLNETKNLRSLEILCPPIEEPSEDDSLPDLPHLESLDLSSAKFPISLVDKFIDQHAQTLRSLWVSLYRWNDLQAKHVTNLKHLQITSLCVQENLNHLYSQLDHLKDVKSLSKLSLTVMVPVKAKTLFGFLQYFKNLRTLRILILENATTHPRLQDSTSTTDCPCLATVHTLEITLSTFQKSFKFLHWFQALTHLHLMTELAFMDNLEQEDLGKHSPHDRISRYLRKCILKKSADKSSIWTILPSLQVLTFYVCRRNGKHEDLMFIRDKCV